MRDGTYHKDIRLPAFTRPTGEFMAVYSKHARDRARSKGFMLPATHRWGSGEFVEVTMKDGEAVKFVVRFPYTHDDDLVLVLHPDGYCRTAWLNARTDTHRTLNRSKYVN